MLGPQLLEQIDSLKKTVARLLDDRNRADQNREKLEVGSGYLFASTPVVFVLKLF